jgi:hypothetical protein
MPLFPSPDESVILVPLPSLNCHNPTTEGAAVAAGSGKRAAQQAAMRAKKGVVSPGKEALFIGSFILTKVLSKRIYAKPRRLSLSVCAFLYKGAHLTVLRNRFLNL